MITAAVGVLGLAPPVISAVRSTTTTHVQPGFMMCFLGSADWRELRLLGTTAVYMRHGLDPGLSAGVQLVSSLRSACYRVTVFRPCSDTDYP